MGKQKLIEGIKNNAKKQIEAEIQASVVKELYGTSKKEIKKLKKQILKELRKDMFATKSKKIKKEELEIVETVFEHGINTNSEDIESITKESSKEDKRKSKEDDLDTLPYEPGRIFEYRGFKFDVDRMSRFVTGNKKELFKERIKSPMDELDDLYESKSIAGKGVDRVDESKPKDSGSGSILKDRFSELVNKEKASDSDRSDLMDRISELKRGEKKDDIKTAINKPASNLLTPNPISGMGFNLAAPASKTFVKTNYKLTPARKEEVEFFVGKLKEGIDKLGKGEKNINYRRKTLSGKSNVSANSDIYVFTYDKPKSDVNDFSLNFEIDLDIYTYGANIIKFDFNVGGFNFDSSFLEIIDIAKVLDAVGMNLSQYIGEIEEINKTNTTKKNKDIIETKERLRFNKSFKKESFDNIESDEREPSDVVLKEKKKTIRANTKVENIIDDAKIIKALANNDITNYGNLKKIEDFTILKGIGAKSAKKIQECINAKLK